MKGDQGYFEKTFKVAIIFCFLLIAFSIAYYLVIFLPQKEKMRIELENQARVDREKNEKERVDKENEDRISQKREIEIKSLEQKRLLEECLENAYNLALKKSNLYDSLNCDKYSGTTKSSCLSGKSDALSEIVKTRKEDESLCYERFPYDN